MDDSSPPDYEFGGFHLDTALHVLMSRDGEPIALPSRAFEVLLQLVGRAGELVEKSALMAAVWPRAVVEENNLNQCIVTLRKVLGEAAGERRFILTVPGRGFKFVAPVRVVPRSLPGLGAPDITPPTLASSASPSDASAIEAADAPNPIAPRAAPIAGRPGRWGAVSTVAALALALGFAAWLIPRLGKSPASFSSAAAGSIAPVVVHPADASPAAAPNAIAMASIAVLPFDNQTGEKDKDYWGDGMAEELINSLSRVTGLQVRSKTSSFAYKGRAEDVRKIASDLRVARILEGTVQKGGDLVRVNVQLVDGGTGQVIVSQNFEEKFADLFKLYDDVSRKVVKVMNVDVSERQPQSVLLAAPPTRDVEAYRLTLQGFAMMNRGDFDAESALGFFQRATARDPDYARAYAGIATAHLMIWNGRSSESEILAAEQADRHALQLDPNSAEAEAGLGVIAFLRRDMVAAEEHDLKAEMLDPNDAMHRFVHAQVEAYLGHMREAVQEMRTAYALAPAIASVVAFTGTVHSWADLDADALKYEQLAEALGVPKDSPILGDIRGLAAVRAGHYDTYLHDSFLLSPNEPQSDVAPAQELNRRVLQAITDPANTAKRAAALAARLQLYPPGRTLTKQGADQCGYNGVRAYVLLGDLDVAYALANQCLDEAPAGLLGGESCPWQPEWRKFREDPRFQAYIARRGALPYYEKYGPPDDCEYKDGKLTCH